MVGGNSPWYEKVRIAFDIYEGNMEELPPGYQYVSCHIIFDVNMRDNFRHKALIVEGGHNTTTPSSLTYLSVVSRNIVKISLTILELNYLKVIECNIHNA